MSNPFDASRMFEGPISADVAAEHARKIDDLMQRPNALANAKLHAENELVRLAMACNRTAWGTVGCAPRAPTREEAAALFARLAPDVEEKLVAEVRRAAEQRTLVALMEDAHRRTVARLEAEQAEAAQREVEAAEWAEFEAHDAAGREQRFLAWRTARA